MKGGGVLEGKVRGMSLVINAQDEIVPDPQSYIWTRLFCISETRLLRLGREQKYKAAARFIAPVHGPSSSWLGRVIYACCHTDRYQLRREMFLA